MNWSPQQSQALSAVSQWRQSKSKPWFYVAGYAGTGKSTLAKHFAEGIDGAAIFASFTGKAALVMQRKGCEGASTIHSLIYHPREKSRERLRELEKTLQAALMHERYNDRPEIARLESAIAAEKKNLNRPAFVLNEDSDLRNADLLIIDECSMVGQSMAEDLLYFEVPILVLGDPAQLPPVGQPGYFTKEKPDILLTDIHRQARDNPIIAMATAVREGRGLEYGTYGDSLVITPAEYRERPEIDPTKTQVIVGKNKTRWRANLKIRKHHLEEADDLVMAGEKVVCLKNNHDLGILNGSLWVVQGCADLDSGAIWLALKDEDDPDNVVEITTTPFYFERTHAPDPEAVPEPDYWELRQLEVFDYGYALTCHKSQGSQWPDVVVIDEAWGSTQEKRRWAYTAITRASERVTVVR